MGMWKEVKEALFNWFFLILFTFISFMIILGLTTEIPKLFEGNEEKIVEETFTSKGLYFGLQYYAHLSDGEVHRILKRDFLSLEKGDTFKMFFNQSSFKDVFLFMTILMLMLCGFLALVYLFASNIFGQMRWFKWIDGKKEQLKEAISLPFKKKKKVLDMFKRVIMIVLILSLSLMLLIVAKNAVYKVMPLGKTNVVAEVIDHEKDRAISPRHVIYTYTLTYKYADKDGKTYKTKKNVSSATYNMYKNSKLIPIMYRNNLPYDTFIDNRTIGEYFSPFLNIVPVLFFVVGYLVYFLIQRYLKIWGIPFIRPR